MKKFVFSMLCFFSLISIYYGESISLSDTDYYVKFETDDTDTVYNVKKIYDTNTLGDLFSLNYNYLTGDNFNVYDTYDESNWKISSNDLKNLSDFI